MEEDKKETTTTDEVKEGEVVNNKGFDLKSFIIKYKKIELGVICAIVAILIIVGIVNAVKPTPQKTVKSFLKAVNTKNSEKITDYIDEIGLYTAIQSKSDYYVSSYDFNEDFKDDYDDNKDDHEEDIEDDFDEAKDSLEDTLGDYDKIKVEIKDINKGKKVKDVKNLYKVTAKVRVETKEDDDTDRDTSQYYFYVYKKNDKYKIVGIETKSGDGTLVTLLQDILDY